MEKKHTTSKTILLISYIIGVALTVIVIVGTFYGYEMGNVTTLAVASWGEIAVSNAFYYNKAKRENTIKIVKSLPPEQAAAIDLNQIINGG